MNLLNNLCLIWLSIMFNFNGFLYFSVFLYSIEKQQKISSYVKCFQVYLAGIKAEY